MDGLLCRGRSHRGGRVGGVGNRDRDLRLDRRKVGGDATVCGSSSLDVAMLSLVMLGRRAQADWRVGNGHRGSRPVGRSPGDLDELARATHGIRDTRAERAKTRGFRARSSTSPSGTKASGYVGSLKSRQSLRSPRIGTRPERITTRRCRRSRCQKSTSTLDVSWPKYWRSGTSRDHRRSTRSCLRCDGILCSARDP
jgi:hypothetical protein